MKLDTIESELREIEENERNLRKKIVSLCRQNKTLVYSVKCKISSICDDSNVMQTRGARLDEKISETAQISEKISKHLRHLHKVKNRLDSVHQRVDDILDLKNCTDGIKIALDNEDFEIAAGHIHRYRSLDTNFLKNNVTDSSSIQASIEILEAAEAQMMKVTRSKFQEAFEQGDAASIERFFKIYPLLGLEQEGLTKFVSFLSHQLDDTTSKNLSMATDFASSDNHQSVIFSDTFILLFEGLARIIEIHQPLVETYYGPGNVATFIFLLQAECDGQASRIFKQFVESRQLKMQLAASKHGLSADMGIKSTDIDALIHEIVLINDRAELYLRFVQRRINKDYEMCCQSDEQLSARMAEVRQRIGACGLTELVQELIGYYLQLEAIFLNESFKLAVETSGAAAGAADGEMTSSMVDDVFFVLKKCLSRAVSTGSADATCAMINISNAMLENEYAPALLDELKGALPSGYLEMMLTGRYQSDAMALCKSRFLLCLNSCVQSAEYVETLVCGLTAHWNSVKAGSGGRQEAAAAASDKGNAKVMACLEDMRGARRTIEAVLAEGHSLLAKYFLKPLIRSCTDSFSHIPHVLDDDELIVSETDDEFSVKVIAPVDTFVNEMRQLLLASNFEKLVSNFTDMLLVSLEKALFKMKFSRNGGLALDREMRSLAQYISSVTEWSVRAKFQRMFQISSILNLEQVEEVKELGMSAAGGAWKLSPSEMKQVLILRDDFSAESIRKIVL